MKKIHLFLGLSVGLMFLLLGMSGAGLVYKKEIQSQGLPQLGENYLDEGYLTLDQMQGALADRFDQLEVRSLSIPEDPRGFYLFTIKYLQGDEFHYQRVWVNPISAAVIPFSDGDGGFVDWLYQLHSGEVIDTGHMLVGMSGLGIVLLLFTGVLTWWPGINRLKKSLVFSSTSSRQLVYSRLHRLTGLLLLPIFLLIVVTGVMLVFRSTLITPWQTPPVEEQQGLYVAKRCVSPTLNTLQFTAEQQFPDAYLTHLKFPRNAQRPIAVTLRHVDEIPSVLGLTKVYIKPQCTSITSVVDGRARSSNDALLELVLAIHNGSYFGLLGQLVLVVLGFSPLVFLFTGIYAWRSRKRQQTAAL